MISPNYYKDNNLVNLFLGGKVQHYLIKPPIVVVQTRDYQVQANDTMYTLAKRVFGVDNEHLWTIISDINFLRQPNELQAGEWIKLPVVILDEARYNKVNYDKTQSATSKI